MYITYVHHVIPSVLENRGCHAAVYCLKSMQTTFILSKIFFTLKTKFIIVVTRRGQRGVSALPELVPNPS